MGFPVVYSEMPRLLLNLLFLLGHLRRVSSWLLSLVGADVADYPTISPDDHHPMHLHQEHYRHGHDPAPAPAPAFGAMELDEHSPAVRFDALPSSGGDGPLPEGCAVCLGDFHGAATVRRPRGCRHVFHRACLDRWAAHGRRTCPLCRAPILPPPPSLAPVLLPMPLPAS